MFLRKNNFYGKFIAICSFIFLFNNCIDPVPPEFEFKEGLLVIDAIATTTIGGSYVVLSESALKINSKTFVQGASVSFRNANTGEVVNLVEEEETYLPPLNFVVAVGDSWELHITLEDGRTYQSLPETVLEPVAIKEVSASYDPELVFRADSGDFVPGHKISVSVDNQSSGENYFYWRYRSFEKLNWCKRCTNGRILRNGVCEEPTLEEFLKRKDYYDYTCTSDCWKIRYSENISVFEDEFTDAPTIYDLPIADVLLYTKENIMVEVQQFSLTAASYEYYKILKDLIDNNGGFNAPPPAALIGNVFNSSDNEEFVLGRFTAAAATTKTIFIPRVDIVEARIEPTPIRLLEGCPEVCPPIACAPGYTGPPCPVVLGTTCEETRYSTAFIPEGWID